MPVQEGLPPIKSPIARLASSRGLAIPYQNVVLYKSQYPQNEFNSNRIAGADTDMVWPRMRLTIREPTLGFDYNHSYTCMNFSCIKEAVQIIFEKKQKNIILLYIKNSEYF